MKDKVDVKFLLLFDLDEEIMMKRLKYRAQINQVKRDDDNEETMKKLIETYRK